jgi:hypothetical protein
MGLYRVDVQHHLIVVMQSRTTTAKHACLETSVFISYYSRYSFFVQLMPHSIPLFLNVAVLHYNVFTKAVNNQTSNWLLVG